MQRATPDPERLRLWESVRRPATLEAVCEAVSVASQGCHVIRIERWEDGWRWSPAHKGGIYPLLRETARFLGIPHYQLLAPFAFCPRQRHSYTHCEGEDHALRVHSLSFGRHVDPEGVRRAIQALSWRKSPRRKAPSGDLDTRDG